MLRAETEGNPSKVEVQIMTLSDQGTAKSTGYFAELIQYGKKKGRGDEIWEGSCGISQ
jgi:predicted component of type VI protein secretion system